MLSLIDTHAHLDGLEPLEPALKRGQAAGVVAVVAVGMGLASNRKVLEIAARYPGFVYPALGLHPSELGGMALREVEDTLRFLEANVSQVVALGEVGLDYDKRVLARADRERQKAVFRDILSLARKSQKPVLVHSRYA